MDENGPEGLARAYVALGLRLGRVVPGLVDAHLGDPAIARRIADEPVADPAVLRREAGRLRRRLASDRAPGADRAEYLDAQLAACEVIAARAAGEDVGVAAEVRGCLGVEVVAGDPDAYRAAHDRLADLLATTSRGLPAALAAFRERDRVAPELLRPGLAAMTVALRECTAAVVGLPPGEGVDLEIVTGVPWAGFARRVGPGRSVMQVSHDGGHRRSHLPLLAAHEAYPGHHTEMVRAEADPAPERALFLARTPQSLVAEGAAECGIAAVVGPGWGAWSAGHLAAAGVTTTAADGALGEAVEDAMLPLAAVRQDAALLLHGGHAVDREEQARAHLRRWLLIDDDRAGRMLEFLAHPRWRIHTTTYVEGVRLVRPWLDAEGAGSPGPRFARLLDEAWTPARLRRETLTGREQFDTGSDTPRGHDERYPGHADDSSMSPTV
ncbi:DUF885 domain-containing protein [Actinomycetospora endophytica]|uniref:DUF885 domain-containing protein n=1 Tax=Actinomycetospora endophytica TaxID=2291215 RepID=UPI0022A8F705|nr:DUF885 domain-containing protein [Actinomycetospora endophytica]